MNPEQEKIIQLLEEKGINITDTLKVLNELPPSEVVASVKRLSKTIDPLAGIYIALRIFETGIPREKIAKKAGRSGTLLNLVTKGEKNITKKFSDGLAEVLGDEKEEFFLFLHNPDKVRAYIEHWRKEALARMKKYLNELSSKSIDQYSTSDFSSIIGFWSSIQNMNGKHSKD